MTINLKEYNRLHYWVRKHKGKAIKCEYCGSKKFVQHANISREYKWELSDFKQLCRSCHAKYDWTKVRRLKLVASIREAEHAAVPRKAKKDHRGEKNPNVKLKLEQVETIIMLYQKGDYSQTELAATFGVKQSTISRVVHRQNWRKVV